MNKKPLSVAQRKKKAAALAKKRYGKIARSSADSGCSGKCSGKCSSR